MSEAKNLLIAKTTEILHYVQDERPIILSWQQYRTMTTGTKTIVQKFNKYYRPWLVGLGLFGLLAFGLLYYKQREFKTETVLTILALLMIGSILLGIIYHWFYEYYQPRRIKRGLKKLVDLEKLGFQMDDTMYSGTYKNYWTTISPVPTPRQGEFLSILMFIAPKEHQESELQEIKKKIGLQINEGLFMVHDRIGMPFGRTPKLEKITNKLDRIIDELTRLKIQPLEIKKEKSTATNKG